MCWTDAPESVPNLETQPLPKSKSECLFNWNAHARPTGRRNVCPTILQYPMFVSPVGVGVACLSLTAKMSSAEGLVYTSPFAISPFQHIIMMVSTWDWEQDQCGWSVAVFWFPKGTPRVPYTAVLAKHISVIFWKLLQYLMMVLNHSVTSHFIHLTAEMS